MRRFLIFALLGVFAFGGLAAEGITVWLKPADASEIGPWALGKAPFRLKSSLDHKIERKGPELVLTLYGLLELGSFEYPILFGTLPDGTPYLAVDFDGDWTFEESEGQKGKLLSEKEWAWRASFSLHGRTYDITFIWPEGRGFLFLVGHSQMKGLLELEGKEYEFVLVDGDVNGRYGDEADFYAVDVDGDGVIHGEEGGHERFSLEEPFTIGFKSFKVEAVAEDGSQVKLVPTDFVPPKVPLYVGAPAPDFSIVTIDGKEISLSDFRGKVVLIDFWASWCVPCIVATPKLLKLYEEFHDRGLEIIGVSLDLALEHARTFIEHQGIPWPQYWDGKGYEGKLVQLFRVRAIPTLFLIDRKGIIRGRWLGLAEEEVRKTLEELLGKDDGSETRGEASEAVTPPDEVLEVLLPPRISLPRTFSGKTSLKVTLRNVSEFEADEVKISLREAPPGVSAEEVTVGSIGPGSEATLDFPLSVEGLDEGEYPLEIGVNYSFCVSEDACFKDSRVATSLLIVRSPGSDRSPSAHEPKGHGDSGEGGRAFPWLLVLGIGAVLVVAFFLLND